MSGEQYRQLVANLKIDGRLTSVPLIYKGEVISGNHRVKAALDAGIDESEVIEITEELTPDRLLALQLSHNAIVGQDDPGVLGTLYKGLDLRWKQYSGLTDAVLSQTSAFQVGALALGTPKYQEMVLLFLPEFAENFDAAIKGVEKRLKNGVSVLAGRLADFNAFFDSVIEVKKVRGIHNSALAVLAMAEITHRVLEQETADKAGPGEPPPGEPPAGEGPAGDPPSGAAPPGGDHA